MVGDEVVGSDMVRTLRPQTDAGAVIEPELSPLGLPCWNLRPLAPPYSLDPLPVHNPARMAKQGRDPAIGVAAGQFRQFMGCSGICTN